MRVGKNPQRNIKVSLGNYNHQIVMPLYIPHFDDYYEECFEIFKISLASSIKTSSKETFISVVCSCCYLVAEKYVYNLYDTNQIKYVIITKGIGKINSILKGLSGINLPFVTITDADVLFLNSSQQTNYEIFSNFSKVSFVSTTPSSKFLRYNTHNIIIDHSFSKNLKFSSVKDFDAVKCVLEGGHFVGTYRRETFNKPLIFYTDFLLGGNSENEVSDLSVKKNGFYSVSTDYNLTTHIGNKISKKHVEKLQNLSSNDFILNISSSKPSRTNKFYLLKKILFEKIIMQKSIWKIFLNYKGLTHEAIAKY